MIILLLTLISMFTADPRLLIVILIELLIEFVILTKIKHRGERQGEAVSKEWMRQHTYNREGDTL